MDRPKFFRTEFDGEVLIVTLLATLVEHPPAECAAEAERVRQLPESGRFQHIVIDLGKIPNFGTSVFLDGICRFHKHGKSRGSDMTICNLSESDLEAAQSFGRIQWLWGFATSREEALERCRKLHRSEGRDQ